MIQIGKKQYSEKRAENLLRLIGYNDEINAFMILIEGADFDSIADFKRGFLNWVKVDRQEEQNEQKRAH